MAFGTWLNEQSWNLGSSGSGETDLREIVRATHGQFAAREAGIVCEQPRKSREGGLIYYVG
jgi:hypothetical protein